MAKAKLKAAQVSTFDGYGDLWSCRTAVGAFTIAAMIVLGFVNVSDKGTVTKGRRRFDSGKLRKLCRSTMVNHWRKVGRLDDNGLTVAGLNEIEKRLSDEKYPYRTNMDAVKKARISLETGADLELENQVFKIQKVVTF